jgi:leucyl aminopeptidase (aminopeptidase T)
MNDMFWRAVDVSPALLATTGKRVAETLKPGAQVHMTSAAGTDLTFKIDRLPARINAGNTSDVVQASGPAQVWLPAGEAYVCVDNGSANGTLVVPQITFRGVPISNLRMKFERGRMTDLSADDKGELLREFLDASTPNSKHLSLVDIGLNPYSQPLPSSDYYSWEMGGMVTVGLGNNSWAGGDNDADGALTVHVAGATVTVDGAKVIAEGRLQDKFQAR